MALNLVVAAFLFSVQVLAQQPVWAQCGGIGWTGGTTCIAGATCTKLNDYYFQCLPGASTATTTATQTTTQTTTVSTTSTTSANTPTATVPRGSLQQISNFGDNPTNIQMYIYVPAKLAAKPPVVVAIHYCGGTGPAYYSYTKLPSYADQLGFILIYPSTTHDSNCWDVGSSASLHHDTGGDSGGIVSMVEWTLSSFNGDPTRVFSVGSSSGAMMTNNLAATYPDVFAAGAAFSGFPYGCRAGSSSSSPFGGDLSCPNGQVVKTAQQWADLVHSAYPGYNGTYPRMQLWHGTADTLVNPTCLTEEIKQWTQIHGVSFSKNVTNSPSSGFTEMVYGDGTQVVAYVQQGGGHPTPVQEQAVLSFFGIA